MNLNWVAALVGYKMVVVVVVHRVLALELVGDGVRKKFGHSVSNICLGLVRVPMLT